MPEDKPTRQDILNSLLRNQGNKVNPEDYQNVLIEDQKRSTEQGMMPTYGTQTQFAPELLTEFEGTIGYKNKNLGVPIWHGYDFLKERRAEVQTVGDRILKTFPRISTKVVSEILKMPGYVGGAVDWASTGFQQDEIGKMVDNSWVNSISQAEDYVKNEILPIYTPKSVQEGGLWKNITSSSFWATEGADGVGFLVSMLVPGQFLKVAKLGTLGAKGVNLATKFGKLGKMVKPGWQGVKIGEKGIANIDNIGAVVANTLFESASEAGESFDKIKNQLIAQGWSEEDAKAKAGEGAVETLLANFAILIGPNALTQNQLFKAFRRTQGLNKLIGEGGELLTQGTKRSFKQSLPTFGKELVKSVASEGFFEEGLQFASSKYFEDKTLGVVDDYDNYLEGILGTYIDNIDNVDMQKGIFLGGILGGGISLISARGKIKDENRRLFGNTAFTPNKFQKLIGIKERKESKGLLSLLENNYLNRYKDFEQVYKKDEKDNYILDDSGNRIVDQDKLSQFKAALINDDTINLLQEAAIKTGDELTFDFLKNIKDIQYMLPYLQQPEGIDLLIKHIDHLAEQDVNYIKDILQKDSSTTTESIKQDLISKARRYQKIYNSIQDTHNTYHTVNYDKKDEAIFRDFNEDLKRSKLDHAFRQDFYKNKIREFNTEALLIDPLFGSLLEKGVIKPKLTPEETKKLDKLEKDIKSLQESLDDSIKISTDLYDNKKQQKLYEDYLENNKEVEKETTTDTGNLSRFTTDVNNAGYKISANDNIIEVIDKSVKGIHVKYKGKNYRLHTVTDENGNKATYLTDEVENNIKIDGDWIKKNYKDLVVIPYNQARETIRNRRISEVRDAQVKAITEIINDYESKKKQIDSDVTTLENDLLDLMIQVEDNVKDIKEGKADKKSLNRVQKNLEKQIAAIEIQINSLKERKTNIDDAIKSLQEYKLRVENEPGFTFKKEKQKLESEVDRDSINSLPELLSISSELDNLIKDLEDKKTKLEDYLAILDDVNINNDILELIVQKNIEAQWFLEKYKGLLPRTKVGDITKMTKATLNYIKSKRWFKSELIDDLKKLEDIEVGLKRKAEDIEFIKSEVLTSEEELKQIEKDLEEFKKWKTTLDLKKPLLMLDSHYEAFKKRYEKYINLVNQVIPTEQQTSIDDREPNNSDNNFGFIKIEDDTAKSTELWFTTGLNILYDTKGTKYDEKEVPIETTNPHQKRWFDFTQKLELKDEKGNNRYYLKIVSPQQQFPTETADLKAQIDENLGDYSTGTDLVAIIIDQATNKPVIYNGGYVFTSLSTPARLFGDRLNVTQSVINSIYSALTGSSLFSSLFVDGGYYEETTGKFYQQEKPNTTLITADQVLDIMKDKVKQHYAEQFKQVHDALLEGKKINIHIKGISNGVPQKYRRGEDNKKQLHPVKEQLDLTDSTIILQNGIPILQYNDGRYTYLDRRTLTPVEADLVLELISKSITIDKSGEVIFNKDATIPLPKGKYAGDKKTTTLDIIPHAKGRPALLSQLINWGGPKKGNKFKEGHIYIDPVGKQVVFLHNGVLKRLALNLVKDTNANKELKDFLEAKPINVNQFYLSQNKNLPYFHPRLSGNEITFDYYKNYDEYLTSKSAPLQTDIIKSSEGIQFASRNLALSTKPNGTLIIEDQIEKPVIKPDVVPSNKPFNPMDYEGAEPEGKVFAPGTGPLFKTTKAEIKTEENKETTEETPPLTEEEEFAEGQRLLEELNKEKDNDSSNILPKDKLVTTPKPKADINKALDNLRKIFGEVYTYDKVEIVAGLIEGKSYGRFLRDGKILLSDQLATGVEYHEAFHRVFKVLIEKESKDELLAEFRGRKDYKKLIEEKRSEGYKGNEDSLIEEVLADEFVEYMLSGKIQQPEGVKARSIFQRILDFLKDFFRVAETPATKSELFKLIKKGGFRNLVRKDGSKTDYITEDADKLKVGDIELTASEKNALMKGLTNELLSIVYDQGAIYNFLKADTEQLRGLYKLALKQTVKNILTKAEKEKNIRLIKIGTSVNNNYLDIINSHSEYLKEFNINIDKVDEDDSLTSDEESLDEEERGRKSIDFIASVEISVKERMSRAVKLLAATMPKVSKVVNGQSILETNELGLVETENYKTMTAQLFNVLAGVPADVYRFVEDLEKTELAKYVPILKQRLGFGDTSFGKQKLRNEFTQAFSKTKKNFITGVINKDGSVSIVNSNSQATRDIVLLNWNSSITRSIQNNSNFYEEIAKLKNRITNPIQRGQIYSLLGIEVGDKLLRDSYYDNALQEVVNYLINKKEEPILIAIKNLFDNKFKNVENDAIRRLAEAQSKLDMTNELQVFNGENKLVYSVTLNDYQSQIIDGLNYFSFEEAKTYFPHLFNAYTTNSKWLAKFSNTKMNSLLLDSFKFEGEDAISLENLKEADLYSFFLNSLLEQGIYVSMKHADRSLFPGYQFEDRSLIVPIENSTEGLLVQSTLVMRGYLADEINRYKLQRTKIQNYDKTLDETKGNVLFNTPEFNTIWNKILSEVSEKETTTQEDLDLPYINSAIKEHLNSLVSDMNKELTKYDIATNQKNAGISKGLTSKHELDHIVKAFTWNTYFGNIEQIKLFSGDLALYAKPSDFFKRLNMQSSTGEISIVNEENNKQIEDFNKATKIVNKDGKEIVYKHTSDGTAKEIVLADNKFQSKSLEDIKKMMEQGLEEEMNRVGTSDILIKKVNYAKALSNAYDNYSENDGFSMGNIFEWREFLHRAGKWSKETQFVFDREVAWLNIENSNRTEEQKQKEQYKLFEIPENVNVVEYIQKYNSVPVISKPQGMGPVYQENLEDYTALEPSERINMVGGRKTSVLWLMPSMVKGTPLEDLNNHLLETETGYVFWNSSAKFGTAEITTPFYNEEGKFVTEDISLVPRTILDYRFFKHQLEISNIPKNKIQTSTQSTKITPSNMFSEGTPVSPLAEEHFNEYSEVVTNLIQRKTKKFLEDIDAALEEQGEGFDKLPKYKINSFSKLREVVLKSAKDRNSARNILEAIESFTDEDKKLFLEGLPNKEKINNILNAMITNNVLKIKRPGDAVPQASITGFETTNRVILENNKIQSNLESLPFYTPIVKEGKIEGTNKAGFIIPLPHKWINWVLEAAGTRSLQEAIDWINSKIEKGELDAELTTKDARIPNQQLSSNDIFGVKKFLNPLTYSSIALVPSELVAKTGGDFDIDKLNIYYRNLAKDKVNGLKDIKYLDDNNSTVEERFKLFDKNTRFYQFLKTKDGYNYFKSLLENNNPLATKVVNALFEYDLDENNKDSRLDLSKSYDQNLKIIKERADAEITLESFKTLSIINQNTQQAVENRLLDVEEKILLSPYNIRNLLTPVSDDFLKNNMMKSVTKKTLGVSKDAKKYGDEAITWNNIPNPINNVIKSVEFLGGSQGIGIVATEITHHVLTQIAGTKVQTTFFIEDEDGDLISTTTEIPFDIMKGQYSFSRTHDIQGKQQIIDALSALENTQVDVVKNPYGIELGIRTQTLPVITYLIRRGTPQEYVFHLVTSKVIQEYLLKLRNNQSFVSKSSGRYDEKKNPLGLLTGNKDIQNDLYKKYPVNEKVEYLTLEQLKNDDKAIQGNILKTFINLVEQAKAATDVKRLLSPDTKYYKTMESAKHTYTTLTEDIKAQRLISSEDINNILNKTFIGSFLEGNKMYYSLYKELSKFETNPLVSEAMKEWTEAMLKYQYTNEAKEKFLSLINNEFITFIIQNANPKFKDAFEKLFKGNNSLAKRLIDAQKKPEFKDNQIIQILLPELNRRDNGRDNIRAKQQGFQTIEINDMLDFLEEVKQYDNQLHDDLVLFTYMQSGVSNSPYNYSKLISNEALSEFRNDFNSYEVTKQDIVRFWDNFQNANPNLVRSWQRKNDKSGIIKKVIDKEITKNIKDSVFYQNYRDMTFENDNVEGTITTKVTKPNILNDFINSLTTENKAKIKKSFGTDNVIKIINESFSDLSHEDAIEAIKCRL